MGQICPGSRLGGKRVELLRPATKAPQSFTISSESTSWVWFSSVRVSKPKVCLVIGGARVLLGSDLGARHLSVAENALTFQGPTSTPLVSETSKPKLMAVIVEALVVM